MNYRAVYPVVYGIANGKAEVIPRAMRADYI